MDIFLSYYSKRFMNDNNDLNNHSTIKKSKNWDQERYGMPVTSLHMDINDRCLGLTNKNSQCKLKKKKCSNYCFVHEERYKLDKPSDCSICYEALDNNDKPTKCGHWYHKKCVDKWLETNTNCPICRTELRTASLKLEIDSSLRIDDVIWERFLANVRSQLRDLLSNQN